MVRNVWERLGPALAPRAVLFGWLPASYLLVIVYFAPDGFFFNDAHIWTSLAFFEWGLCADCAATLWVLAAVVSSLPIAVPQDDRQLV